MQLIWKSFHGEHYLSYMCHLLKTIQYFYFCITNQVPDRMSVTLDVLSMMTTQDLPWLIGSSAFRRLGGGRAGELRLGNKLTKHHINPTNKLPF